MPVAEPWHVAPALVVAERVIESPEPAGTPPSWKSIDALLATLTVPGLATPSGMRLPALLSSANVTLLI
jgi:hypothetical protein